MYQRQQKFWILNTMWYMVFLSLSWVSVRTSAIEGTLMRMFSWPVNLCCPATPAPDVWSARLDVASRVRQWVKRLAAAFWESAHWQLFAGFLIPPFPRFVTTHVYFFFRFKWGWEPDVGISVSWEGRCVSAFIYTIFPWEILSLAD